MSRSATLPDPSPLRTRLWWWLGFLILCRFLLLVFAPHADPTEARYAEMARKMVETNEWMTPQIDYGIPYWAVPPASMWLSAFGIELFGATEFGSRIFTFLSALGILALVNRMGTRDRDSLTGFAAAALLMSMPLFFYCSAAVMPDLIFTAGTTLAMAGFRMAARGKSKAWGYAFFIGLAISLAAKGPLAFAIVFPPILGWLTLTKRWGDCRKNIPWLAGSLLMLALSVPWYLLEEQRTPGFLHYFFIGEHWSRFSRSNWAGDLYGNVHSVMPGTIIVYWLAGCFPVCLAFFAVPIRRWRDLNQWARSDEGTGLYWLLWALWPVALLIPFRNILASDPLPALPATALLLATISIPLIRRRSKGLHSLHPLVITLNTGIVIWAMAVSLVWPERAPKSSEKKLVRRYQHDRKAGDHLLYYGVRKFSAEFYAEGNIDHTGSIQEVEEKLNASGTLYLAVPTRYLPLLPGALQRRFVPVDSWGAQTLYMEQPAN